MEEIYSETPETVCSVNAEKSVMLIEFTMLEVEKADINLMVGETGCYLSAPSGSTLYVATLSFPCPADPAGAKASYGDGYLRVEIPLREEIGNFLKIPVM
ncbi:MAG: Hsp20/alpha crystallin family protein [Nitrospirota bacterium]